MKKTKKQAIKQICKKDNELLHQYMSGKISKKEYDNKKKMLHEKYSKLTNEKERILDIIGMVTYCQKRSKNTDSYNIRELTGKEVIVSLMKHTVNAQGGASCFADNKKYRRVD